MKSLLFVFLQFGTLGLIAITGALIPSNVWLLTIELAGLLLGVWAVFSMGIFNFNITPDVKSGSRFVARGPYALIRHPMYTALLITTLPLLINTFNWFRLAFWLILLFTLLFKLEYEEKLLAKIFTEYPGYIKTTYRLFPFLY
jgi:protein-S-isoprenylcysteine O-methyltransferase Ste14